MDHGNAPPPHEHLKITAGVNGNSEGEKAHEGGALSDFSPKLGGLDEPFRERLPFCKWNLVVFLAG